MVGRGPNQRLVLRRPTLVLILLHARMPCGVVKKTSSTVHGAGRSQLPIGASPPAGNQITQLLSLEVTSAHIASSIIKR